MIMQTSGNHGNIDSVLAEGFHEAFQEIVKAMDDLKKILH